MKYFVDGINALSTDLKNDKGRELYNFCRDSFEHFAMEEESVNGVEEIIKKEIIRLDAKYPRMLKMEVSVRKPTFFTRNGFVDVHWAGREWNRILCFSMRLIKIEGEIGKD